MVKRYSWGIEEMDKVLGPIESGFITMIYGPTASGKTTLSTYIPTMRIAKEIKEKVGEFPESAKFIVMSTDAGFSFERARQIWELNGLDPSEMEAHLVYKEFTEFDEQHQYIKDLEKTVEENNWKPVLIVLDPICYSADTEILTEDGWKFFFDLTKDDKLATLNSEGFLEYHKPWLIIEKYYKGPMYLVQTKEVDLCVTPDHRMYVALRKSTKRKSEWQYELREAREIYGKHVIYKKDALWRGEERQWFVIPEVPKYQGVYGKAIIAHNPGDLVVKMDDWLEFFGYWIAEGTCNLHKGSYEVYITVADKALADRIFEAAKRAFPTLNVRQQVCKQGFRVEVSDKRLYMFLSTFGKSPERFIPKELKQLSPRQLRILLDALMAGDGTTVNGIHKYYFTTSKRLADDLQEIALKIGISANIIRRFRKGEKTRGQVLPSIPKFYKHDHYCVIFNYKMNRPRVYKKRAEYDGTNMIEKWVDYDGPVYCVDVPNHVVYVRRNGKPVWCGNCALYRGIVLRTEMKYRASVIGLYTGKMDLQMAILRRVANLYDAVCMITSWPPSPVGESLGGSPPESPVIGGRQTAYLSKVMLELSIPQEGSPEREVTLVKHRSKPVGAKVRFKLCDAGITI